jgi:hypothetical protein
VADGDDVFADNDFPDEQPDDALAVRNIKASDLAA